MSHATNPGRQKRGAQGIYDVNMTPLIDVSLVLVVILMVAMPMAFQSSIAVRKAAESGHPTPQPTKTERIQISILAPDSLMVNERFIPRAALINTLRPLIESSASRQVVVSCADPIAHGEFVSVIDDAKALGAAQIAILGN